jgi:hypothetical protein
LPGGEAALARLSTGDVFRLFESDGTPAVAADGSTRRRVVSVSAPDPATGEVVVETETVPETSVEAACAAEGSWFPGDAARSGDFGPPRRLR